MMTQPIDAVLLDMDGTILNSIAVAERIWGEWAGRHGLDVPSFIPTIHGMQAIETIRRLALPQVDPETEAATITQLELDDVDGIKAITGASEFLAALANYRWAIVTSAPRALALRRIRAAGLPEPPLLIAAEDVEQGKPAPDCFLLAAARLGTTADKCLVMEDSPAGIKAAERAGARLLVVTETHHQPMESTHPLISNYLELSLEQTADGATWIRRINAPTAIAYLLQPAASK
ncbi:MAG: HAD-IA family hydrolase [Candidatus Pseudobacter hemicellulosilyticus]|uniref:HAD-IA family hydrolase n=1 Tax=Candidatus Pseudobacter hemicellulosilyticus TaxID=3121375 RepID=A0AAJ6BEV4_9BACT|nr:MAG: HAD-IA family hydrolase [Pseudobacter sp.]